MADVVDEPVDDENIEASLLRVVLIARALNEARVSGVLSALSGDELLTICRPILAKLRAMCEAALGDDGEATIN